MRANHGKCHFLLSTQDVKIQTTSITISCSRLQQLLGIVFDNKLKFDKHINVCQKANRKCTSRVTSDMELPKRRILMNTFFKVQFYYCPAVWIFYSRSLNNRINRLHEHCLRIIYNDKLLCFEKLCHSYIGHGNVQSDQWHVSRDSE